MEQEKKKKREITFKNILSFIEGNTNYILDRFGFYPDYKQEQVLWRLNICKMDCVKEGACVYCGCPPTKKAFAEASCNNGDRFPDIMEKKEWEKYKEDNNINIDTDGTGL